MRDDMYAMMSSIPGHGNEGAASPASPSPSCNSCPSDSSSSPRRISSRRTSMTPPPALFCCNLCPRRFVHASSLKRHVNTHAGLRKYSCTTCEKSFQQSTTLKSHMLTHSGVKPFACHICDMSFSQSGYRNQHVLKVHRVATTSCSPAPESPKPMTLESLPEPGAPRPTFNPFIEVKIAAPIHEPVCNQAQFDDDFFNLPSLDVNWDVFTLNQDIALQGENFFQSLWA